MMMQAWQVHTKQGSKNLENIVSNDMKHFQLQFNASFTMVKKKAVPVLL